MRAENHRIAVGRCPVLWVVRQLGNDGQWQSTRLRCLHRAGYGCCDILTKAFLVEHRSRLTVSAAGHRGSEDLRDLALLSRNMRPSAHLNQTRTCIETVRRWW